MNFHNVLDIETIIPHHVKKYSKISNFELLKIPTFFPTSLLNTQPKPAIECPYVNVRRKMGLS